MSSAFFDPAEGFSRDEIRAVQTVRLAASIERAKASPFYAERLKDIDPGDIRCPEDVRRLPPTTKDDLRASYPDGLVAAPREKLVRLHASSGTTGSPTVIFHTQNDLNSWADLMARCMHMVGARPGDPLQNMSGYGLFTGGLGIHYGAERLGCLTIPAGAGNTKRQIKLIMDFNVQVLHIIPSYALYFGSVLRDMGVRPEDFPPRIALIGAEPHTEGARRKIEALLGLKAYNSFGLSEMNGPGVAFECQEQDGMHLWEDAYIAEIVDPETLEPVAEGEVGELVMTTLCREGMPILRYRTRDLTRFLPGECACGRKHARIDRIKGRADDMFIVKGVNVYPMQIEQVLMAMPEVGENYLIELTRHDYKDDIVVKVEVKEEFFVEDMRALGGLQKRIAGRLRDEILVTPRVELVEHNSLPKSEGKAKRVNDLRGENGNG
ncbi:MAG: phenylacetate--CoA ligase [Thermodesulfobacteriota bacterium]